MWNAVKRIAGSAPAWAWIAILILAAVLVAGLVIASNRAESATSSANWSIDALIRHNAAPTVLTAAGTESHSIRQ